MKYTKKAKLCASSAMVIAVLMGAPVHAQNVGQTDSKEVSDPAIIVTATRRSETTLEVPISIAVMGQEQMDKQGVRSMDDITRLTPGVSQAISAQTARQGAVLSIRGISSGAGSATVGVYIDDTPIQVRPVAANSSNPYPRIFDIARVEILRGPQGTLFGAGSQGGTVRFITPTPDLYDTQIYGRSEISSTANGGIGGEAGLAVGVPIVEGKLAIRASGWYRHEAGYVDRYDVHNNSLVDEDSNSGDYFSGRVALNWQPTDTLTITPSIFYQNTKANDTSQFFENFSTEKDLRNGFPTAQYSHDRFILPALQMQLDVGKVSLFSATSYLDRKTDSGFDSTYTDNATLGGFSQLPPPAPLDSIVGNGTIDGSDRFFTQEVRLQSNDTTSPFRWLIGAYYQKTTQTVLFNSINLGIDDLVRANPRFAGFGPNRTGKDIFGVDPYLDKFIVYTQNEAHDEQIAGFGQVDFDITPELTVTAGIRYARSTYTTDSFRAGTVFRTNGTTSSQSQSADPITPKFGVSYKANEDLMLYASVGKGTRIGGTVNALPASCAADAAAIGLSLDSRQINPDSVWSYEVGAKGSLFDRMLQFEGSVYRVDWTDIQSGLRLPNCNIPTTANLGTARSQGFDLQLSARPVDNLNLTAGIGYNDAGFTTTSLGAVNPVTGVAGVLRSAGQPLDTPPWSLSLSGEYTVPVQDADAYLRSDFQYRSHDNTPLDIAAGADPTIGRAPALTNLDLRAGIRLDNIDASIFVSNVTDTRPRFGTYRNTLSTSIYNSVTVRPRTVGLTVTYRN